MSASVTVVHMMYIFSIAGAVLCFTTYYFHSILVLKIYSSLRTKLNRGGGYVIYVLNVN